MAAINRLRYAQMLERQLAGGAPLEQAHKAAVKRGQRTATKLAQLKRKRRLQRKPKTKDVGFKPLTQAQKTGWARRRKYRGSISE